MATLPTKLPSGIDQGREGGREGGVSAARRVQTMGGVQGAPCVQACMGSGWGGTASAGPRWLCRIGNGAAKGRWVVCLYGYKQGSRLGSASRPAWAAFLGHSCLWPPRLRPPLKERQQPAGKTPLLHCHLPWPADTTTAYWCMPRPCGPPPALPAMHPSPDAGAFAQNAASAVRAAWPASPPLPPPPPPARS